MIVMRIVACTTVCLCIMGWWRILCISFFMCF